MDLVPVKPERAAPCIIGKLWQGAYSNAKQSFTIKAASTIITATNTLDYSSGASQSYY
jgi:hypothetical protein